MTGADIKALIIEEIGNIAPDIIDDAKTLDGHADIREELDLDSMDFLNLVIALHKKLDVEIPETDYPKLFTISGAVDYLMKKVGSRA